MRAVLVCATLAGLLPVGAIVGAAGCAKRAAGRSKVVTAVRVQALERAGPAPGRRYSATVAPATKVDVAFRVGGYVAEVLTLPGADGRPRPFQDGDRVDRGQPLVTLRQQDFIQKRTEAQASLAAATAARDKAELDFQRVTRLVASANLPASELDAARAQRDAALAQMHGAQARLAEAETALGDSVLRAPIAGVILARGVEVGALASPGGPAFSIADDVTVKVAFGVPDTLVAALHLGARQSVSLEAMPGEEHQGTITRISAAADPQGHVFDVEVSVPNADGRLRPGMVAALELTERAAPEPAAVIPLSAIVRAPGKPGRFAVFVLDDAAAPPVVRVREVELGDLLGNRIPVLAGLGLGERVVVLGAGLLADGEAVEVIP